MDTYNVKYAGICGSDINKIKSKDFDIKKIPYLGHEIVCSDNEGILYVVNPFVCKSGCSTCDNTSFLYCENVSRLGDGCIKSGFSGEISVPPENLYRVPVCDHPQIGVLCDGVAVIIHGLHLININQFSNVAIVGSGSIAILAALIIKDYNPNCEVEVFVRRIDKQEYLISYYSDYLKISDAGTLKNKDEKYDLVIEAVGGLQTESISTAIDIVKKSGTILVFGAFSAECSSLSGIRKLFYKQIHLIGSNSFCKMYNDFGVAVEWTFSHESLLYPLITNQMYASKADLDIMQLYEQIVKKKIIKDCFIYEL